ncbi:hypothetical protein ACFQH5_13435 [Halomonas salifodinae]|uniref:Transcriptional regulator n=1 Tax=Halomonas salifodinae TaxID=438745 RepID=A0ABW2F024_9GAMM
MTKPQPAETLRRLSELWGVSPITLVRRARLHGLDIPEELAGLRPAEYYADYWCHTGTIRDLCEAAGVNIEDYYLAKRRKPHLAKDEILDHLTLEGV